MLVQASRVTSAEYAEICPPSPAAGPHRCRVPDSITVADVWWLHNSLKNLIDRLNAKGIQLHCIQGNSQQLIPKLVSKHNVDAVVWTSRHEPARINIENHIEQTLIKNHIIVKRVKDELLTEPDLFLTKTHHSHLVMVFVTQTLGKARLIPAMIALVTKVIIVTAFQQHHQEPAGMAKQFQ